MPELKLENYFNTYFLIYINFFSKGNNKTSKSFCYSECTTVFNVTSSVHNLCH